MKRKIGILGGSFNPIHEAHISLAKYFLKETDAAKVILVPCYVSPFKLSENSDNAKSRLDMVKIAIRQEKKLEVSDYELLKAGISYTYETIDYFSKLYSEYSLCLLLGGDQAENFHKWKNWKQILDKVNIYVALRKGYKIPTYGFEKYKKATYLEMPFIDVAASEIREQISLGQRNIKYLNSEIEKYILENKIY